MRAGLKGRSVWGIGAAAVIGAATLTTAGPAGAQDTETGEGIVPPGMDWTDEQVEELIGLYEEAIEVLPDTFPTEADSEADLAAELAGYGDTGYYNFGANAPNDGPGSWAHYINPGYVVDGIMIDPAQVESLVYFEDDDGSMTLVSAMYMAAPGVYPEDLPEEIAWYPGWHGHPELCTSSDGTFGGITDPEDPNCPEGTSQALTPLMFHVWIAEENPCDHVFGGIGIQGVHCDHGGHDGHDPDDPDHEHDPDDPGHGDHDGHDEDGHGDHNHTPPAGAVSGDPNLTG